MTQPYRPDPPAYHPSQTGAFPGPQAPSAHGEQTLVELPGFQVTNRFVHTPSGSVPLSRAKWSLTNATHVTQGTPTWAIVLAIVGFFIVTIFSLLFLLAKESRVTGTLIIAVSGEGVSHVQHVQVTSQAQLSDVISRYEYARSLR